LSINLYYQQLTAKSQQPFPSFHLFCAKQEMSIQVSSLSKHYGLQMAVDQISFKVNEGEIVGFLGPNGAGKSTAMKILTGFLPPSGGIVLVNGESVVDRPLLVKRQIGYLPEHNPLYLDMYVHEYLNFMAGVFGLPPSSSKKRVFEMVALCGLTDEQNKKIGMLSKGYRQRVGLAQALIHDPSVLILDEPTSGLDPNQLVEIRKLIKTVSREKTVLFSTHILQEVEALCDRVIVINKGKIVADDKLERLLKGGGNYLVVEFANAVNESDLATLEGVLEVERIDGNRFRIQSVGGKDLRSELVDFAVKRNLSLIGLKQEEISLESIFSQLTAAETKAS
jgi:ABC-2 type transport system ATP-binding protein